MDLTILRNEFSDLSTIGDIFINDIFQHNILEDKDRGLDSSMSVEQILKIKIKNETCIPYGDYKIGWRISSRFSNDYFWSDSLGELISFKIYRLLPSVKKKLYAAHEMMWILDTKGFDFCYIHWGNTHHDTHGCPLVGLKTKNGGFVQDSRKAYIDLYQKVRRMKRIEDINLKITK